MKLEDFQIHSLAMDLGENVYQIVIKWDYFDKDTIGKQFVKSTDSIAANLSEGLGRYHYKERKNFSYYSRGSLFETKTWLIKSFNRHLITEDQYQEILDDLELIGMKLNISTLLDQNYN